MATELADISDDGDNEKVSYRSMSMPSVHEGLKTNSQFRVL